MKKVVVYAFSEDRCELMVGFDDVSKAYSFAGLLRESVEDYNFIQIDNRLTNTNYEWKKNKENWWELLGESPRE